MAKLRKRPRSHQELPGHTTSSVRKSKSTGPQVLPVIEEQPALNAQQLHHFTNHERTRSDTEVRNVFPGREKNYDPRTILTKPTSPTSPLVRPEHLGVAYAQRKPSPLRISQAASVESQAVVAGPSGAQSEYRQQRCGPSCQKCGRPRKQILRDAPDDEIKRAPPIALPLPGAGIESISGAAEKTIEKANASEPQSAPEVSPANVSRSRRRKYFSLPSKSKPSFKGPTELASHKGKTVEPPTYQSPSQDKARPVSAPSPTKSAFKGSADLEPSQNLAKPGAHVHFARDDHLGRFAAEVRPASASASAPASHQPIPSSLIAGRVPEIASQHGAQATSQAAVNKAQQLEVSPHHPQDSRASRPNSALLYEWPLHTTLVNKPHADPNPRRPTLSNAQSRSSLSISKRPSRRTSRPYHNPHIHAPKPGRTSSRHQVLVQQSRKASYVVDNASNSSLESISISILDMLQGYPGGELAATAKTPILPQLLSGRPNLLRLQTYPRDGGSERVTSNNKSSPDEEIPTHRPYSPSNYDSDEDHNDDDDDDDDDDDQPMPITPPPPQSDFPPISYSVVRDDEQKADRLRPLSTLTQTSFSIGDDRHLPTLARASTPPDLDLGPAPAPTALPLTPNSPAGSPVNSPSPLISAPSASSTNTEPGPNASPHHHPAPSMTNTLSSSNPQAPAALEPEGMIPVQRRYRLSGATDLPEVVRDEARGNETAGLAEDVDVDPDVDLDIDPDWVGWGALPGSYGGAGMWSGSSTGGPALHRQVGGLAELEVLT